MGAPKSSAIWFPILHALIAGGFGAAIAHYSDGNMILAGLLCAFVVWAISTAKWLDILAYSYMPVPRIEQGAAPVTDEPEPVTDYEIICMANPSTHHRIDPECPVTWDWLAHFAAEVVTNGRGVTFRQWVGYDDGFPTNPAYKLFVDWMQERGYANGGLGEKTRLTDLGRCLLKDIVTGSYHRYSPTGEQIIT